MFCLSLTFSSDRETKKTYSQKSKDEKRREEVEKGEEGW